MADVPDTPPALAVMVALPAETPVTSPVDDTAATALFDDDQTSRLAPLGGETVAVNWTVAPMAMLALEGATLTDLTFGVPLANDGDVGRSGVCCRSVEQETAMATSSVAAAALVRFRVVMRITLGSE